MFSETHITRVSLTKLDWIFVKDIGTNCEIWRKEEELSQEMIIWNRVTLKVYVM